MAEAAIINQAAGGEVQFLAPYQSLPLVKLANHMLQNYESKVRLSPKVPKKRVVGSSGVVLLYSGGVYSYIALCRELLLGNKVYVVHLSQGPIEPLLRPLIGSWGRVTSGQKVGNASDELCVTSDFRKIWDILGPSAREAVDLDVQVVRLDADTTVHIALADLLYLGTAAEVAAEYGISRIVYGHTSYTYDLAFYRAASSIISDFYGKKIQVHSPFAGDRPATAIMDHLERGFDPNTLREETFSCNSSQSLARHCGVCWGCYRRWKVFGDLNWGTKSLTNPPWDGEDFHKFEDRWRKLGG